MDGWRVCNLGLTGIGTGHWKSVLEWCHKRVPVSRKPLESLGFQGFVSVGDEGFEPPTSTV